MIMGTTTLRKAVLWFVIVSQLITGSVVVGLYLFNCNPIKKSWLPKTPGKCFVPGRVKYPNMVYLGMLDTPQRPFTLTLADQIKQGSAQGLTLFWS